MIILQYLTMYNELSYHLSTVKLSSYVYNVYINGIGHHKQWKINSLTVIYILQILIHDYFWSILGSFRFQRDWLFNVIDYFLCL